MDHPGPAPAQPERRDMVFCHECENEWYRNEHGLECPDCHSDFTEIIEEQHDPRNDDSHRPADPHPLYDHNPWSDAPDPDEDDIDHFEWQQTGPGEPLRGNLRASINRTYDMNGQPVGQQEGGGLSGILGNLVQGLLGGAQQQYQQQQNQQQNQGRQEGSHDDAAADGRPGSPPDPGRVGSPGGMFTRHLQGPGYSVTFTSSSGATLHPRNANGPQPINVQPDNMEGLMRQMFMNIGAFPTMHQGAGGGARAGSGGFPDSGDPRSGVPLGFPAGLFAHLLVPPGGVHGDAVYSQEALDRIISQLMEQHQTGNAPGPASEAAIKSLPTRNIEQLDLDDQGKADCSICMDAVKLGDKVTVLPCSHWFHGECIKAWLSEHDTCPHCREGIMPKNDNNSGSRPRNPSQAPLNNMNSPESTRPQTTNRQNGAAGGSSGGVFSRMREAFGGSGESSSQGSNGGNNGHVG